MSMIYYHSNDNLLVLRGLRNKKLPTPTYINDATVVVTLKDADGNNLTGETWPLTLTAVGSGGVYQATLQDTIVTTGLETGSAVVTISGGTAMLDATVTLAVEYKDRVGYRTNEQLVGHIIDVNPLHELEPFIVTANELVTEVCAPLGYNTTRLRTIETWLAAHFYAQYQKDEDAKSIGPSSSTFSGQTDMYFESTRWGQTALSLDTKGGLGALQKQVSAAGSKLGVNWLGTE